MMTEKINSAHGNMIIKRAPRNPAIHQCLICRKYHSLRYCKRFLAMSIEGRRRVARQHGYCKNCLARSHKTNDCTSADVCQKCGWGHHTLLHLKAKTDVQPSRRSQAQTRRQVVRNGSNLNATPQQSRNQHQKRNQQQRIERHSANREHPGGSQQRSSRSERRNHPYQVNRSSNSTSPRRILHGALRALSRLEDCL